jgi:hypothetical protein
VLIQSQEIKIPHLLTQMKSIRYVRIVANANSDMADLSDQQKSLTKAIFKTNPQISLLSITTSGSRVERATFRRLISPVVGTGVARTSTPQPTHFALDKSANEQFGTASLMELSRRRRSQF